MPGQIVFTALRCNSHPDTLAMPSIVKATKVATVHLCISIVIVLTIAHLLPFSAHATTQEQQLQLGAAVSTWPEVNQGDVNRYHLTCLTKLHGVNLYARLHKADNGLLSSLVYPLTEDYSVDATNYSLEAASSLGKVQLLAGIGAAHSLDGLMAYMRQIGANYGSASSTTLTKTFTADLPLTNEAKLQARVELVDIDHLRDLAARSDGDSIDKETIAKLGVAGSLALGKAGALQIGYEMAHSIGTNIQALKSSAEAGLEYNLNSQAKIKAGVNYDFSESGTRSVTDVNLGYDLTKDTSLMAGYKLINFNDVAVGDYQTNVAQARLSMKF